MRVFVYLFMVLATVASNSIADKGLICSTEGCKHAAQRIQSYIDTSVNPCDNFYKFACGGFIKSSTIPSDQVEISSYSELADIIKNRLKLLFEKQSQPNEIKPFTSVKRFYKECMDTKSIEVTGLKTIKTLIEQLGGWPVLEGEKWNEQSFDWKTITYKLRDLGMYYYGFLTSYIDSHPRNSTLGIIIVEQAEVELERDILIQGLKNPTVEAYHKLMTNVAAIFGADQQFAKKEILDLLDFEINIAKISIPYLRNVSLTYNPTTLNELQKSYPTIDWIEFANRLFGIVGGPKVDGSQIVNVEHPQFITDLVALLQKTPKRVQANYAIWRAVKDAMPFLTEKILDELFEFQKQQLGVKTREARSQECFLITRRKLKLLVGAMYVREYFSPEAREKANEIVSSLRKIFIQILKDVDWMDSTTKSHALQKIEDMIIHVGYTDELLNDRKLEDYYSRLQFNSDDFLLSGLNRTLFVLLEESERLGQILPRSGWAVRPSAVLTDPQHNQKENAIDLPAGILQDLYFDEKRPNYLNFGGIGYQAGHVITHGFDDVGKQSDHEGNLIDWWNKETNEAFLKKVQCIVDQYNNYVVPEVGLSINGVNTQGENIADNGGVKEAYLAYQDWVKQHSREPTLPGLSYTPNQLFWISSAHNWCSKFTPEYMKLFVQTNEHSPGEFRVNGALQNTEYFSKDFECPVGSPMNPAKKCVVW